MKIRTNLYGELEYQPENIINFKDGLLGFDEFKRYLLLSSWDKDLPFYTLQSVEDNELYFIMIKADEFFADYKIDLTAADSKDIKYAEGDIVQVFNIVRFTEELQNSTVNLRGPVIINFNQNTGKQVVLDNDRYSVRYPLFAKLSSIVK